MKKKISYKLLIGLDLLLLFLIIIIGFKIKILFDKKILGVQYVTQINKENLIFDNSGTNLKYFYEPRPNNIWRERPIWLDYEARYFINSDGLNNLHEYTIAKQGNTYRVITIGDSFTFGAFVNTEDNYPSVLETLLNQKIKCPDIKKFEVLNLGVGGYYVEYAVERFIKRGLKYNPDLVIWLINPHNMRRSNELTRPIINQLNAEGVPAYDPVTKKYESAEKAEFITAKKYGNDFIRSYQKKMFDKFRNIYSGKLLVMTIKNNSIPNSDILNEFIQSNTNYVYYSGLFNTITDMTYSLPDSHPNKVGHQKIAEDIFNYLLKNYLKECSLNKL